MIHFLRTVALVNMALMGATFIYIILSPEIWDDYGIGPKFFFYGALVVFISMVIYAYFDVKCLLERLRRTYNYPRYREKELLRALKYINNALILSALLLLILIFI